MKLSGVVLACAVVTVFASPPYRSRLRSKGDCEVNQPSVAYTNEGSPQILASWTPPSNCADALKYRAKYIIDNDEPKYVNQIAAGVPMALIALANPLYCEKVAIYIETLGDGDSILEATAELLVNLPLPSFEDLKIAQNSNGIQVSWKAIDLPDTCQVSYQVSVNDETPVDPTKPLEHTIDVDVANACQTYHIKVTAKTRTDQTATLEDDFAVKLPPLQVTTADNSQPGQIVIDFEPLSVTDIPPVCGDVKYKLVEKEEACFVSSYSVMAVSSEGIEGIVEPQMVAKNPSSVNNLKANVRTNDVTLEWNPPTDAENCNTLRYSGEDSSSNLLFSDIHTTSYVVNRVPSACTVEKVNVWATLEGLKGEKTSVDVAGDLGTVQELRCSLSEESIKCTWKKPAGCTDDAEITYGITYYNGKQIKTEENYSDDNYAFDTQSCENSWIVVTPILQGHVVGGIYEGSPTCT